MEKRSWRSVEADLREAKTRRRPGIDKAAAQASEPRRFRKDGASESAE